MEGLKLRYVLAKKGKTIDDVAKAIGKSRDTTTLKVDGLSEFKLSEITILAGVLGMGIEDTLSVILEDKKNPSQVKRKKMKGR